MRKQAVALGICAAMVMGTMMGCSSQKPAESTAPKDTTSGKALDTTEKAEVNKDMEGNLVFAIWDNDLMEFIDEKDMVGKFQEKYPNVNVEVEKLKDDSEYWNAMKMRASAGQLPDVMCNKTFTLSRFKDYLTDLSSLKAAKNNELAMGYAIDDQVYGIPMSSSYEYVFYWKDMFQEAGIEVPTTWNQFQEASEKLQAYYGKENPDFMSIALGAKDEWPDYPFMEFMPALESGNGQNWNDMAVMDEPFTEGTDIHKAYTKVYKLFTSGVFGKDPLGIGKDQAVSLFSQKGAGMLALGSQNLTTIQEGADDASQLGTFYLPVRDSEEEPFRTIVQGDTFMGVTTHSKNPELAELFVEWFYSEDCYPEYINYVTRASAMKTFPKEKDPILAEADNAQPEKELVMYDGGGDDFQAIQNEIMFDYKKLGCEMFTQSFDFDARMNELNNQWKTARQKLKIQ